VQFHDVLPTVLELLDLRNSTTSMHGRSFLPVLQGDTDVHREAIITGYHEAPDRCIRDHRWSYLLRPEGEPDELYDLVEDPKERRNLISEHPEVAGRLTSTFGSLFRLQLQARTKGRPFSKEGGIQGKYELASSGIE
jgi:arylsulfatase A-like enzyme